MHKEEAIIKILGKSIDEFKEIDLNKLRCIIEEVLNEYELKPKIQTISTESNIKDKIQIYLISKKLDGLSSKTIYNYKLHLSKFSNSIQKNIEDVTVTDIRIYLGLFKVKNSSLSNIISILKSFFSWLEVEEYISKNPMKKIQNTKVEKRLRKPLDVEEVERLRDSCSTARERALFEFIFATGCRLAEIVNVNIGDLNWNNLSLKVIGKGNKERVVYFSAKSKLYIKKYILTRGKTFDNEPLFITSKIPHGRLGSRSIEKEIFNIAQKAGFDKSIFPHLLRTSMASSALKNGSSLSAISAILGHSTVATTERYAQITDDIVEQEYKKHFVQ